MGTPQTSMRLSREVQRQLAELAKRSSMTRTEVIRRLIVERYARDQEGTEIEIVTEVYRAGTLIARSRQGAGL